MQTNIINFTKNATKFTMTLLNDKSYANYDIDECNDEIAEMFGVMS